MARRERGEEWRSYIPTGLRTWDGHGGISRGILTVLGAATGEGKSVVKLQLARGAAENGKKVVILDFEDPAAKTADRVFSYSTGIDSRQIGKLDIDYHAVRQLEQAVAESEWANRVEYFPGLVNSYRAAEIVRNTEADIYLIDYAQAFPEDRGRGMERTIADFSWKMGEYAQKKNAAVVIFSQIIREVEERGYRIFERSKFRDDGKGDISGFAPGGLSDISWAKALGERAKALGYIWRPGRIGLKLGLNMRDNRLHVIWGKVNFGTEETLIFSFDGPTTTIKDLQ